MSPVVPETLVARSPARRSVATPPPPADYGLPTVWELDTATEPAVTAYVQRHPHGTLYHTPEWLAALGAVGITTPHYLTALAGSTVVGVLPLALSHGPRSRRRLISSPASPTGGILASDPLSARLLLNRARHLARRLACDGIWTRSFRMPTPTTGCHTGTTALDWVRIAVADLPVADDETPQLASKAADVCQLAATAAAGFGVAPATIRALHARGVPLQTVQTADAQQTTLAYWTACGAYIHLLRCTPALVSSECFAAVLAHLGGIGRRIGARWLDCAAPPLRRGVRAAWLSASHTTAAHERRLPL